ncbi:MAG: hypothetical protein RMI91_08885 [Gemmatales bacterium]|nr:hypothetical protein [Gemmatales bacterium]MDW7994753.1 hypothetical protein [Gemmatales bacterium]
MTLREELAVGQQYQVRCRVSLQGTLRLPPEKEGAPPTVLPFTGKSQIDYVERILELGSGNEVRRTFRVYERMHFHRVLGKQEQTSELRPLARRMVLVRHRHLEVPFSPDGPLLWSEIDRVRTDVFPPALVGLLPKAAVRVGDKWQATSQVLFELTDLEQIIQGQLECRFERIVVQASARLAQVSLEGTMTGMSEDGPARHQLSGFYYFDLDNRLLTYISLEGKQSLLDSEGKSVSELRGQFVMTRQRVHDHPWVSDQALRGLKLVPDEENTRLLFEEPELGLGFIYPRRWTVRRADARQVALAEPQGASILITLDSSGQVWTGAKYQQHVEQWLAQEKASVHRRSGIRALDHPAGKLEHFQYEVTLRGERVILDYYAYQHSAGSMTVAGRVPSTQPSLVEDISVVARSLRHLGAPR